MACVTRVVVTSPVNIGRITSPLVENANFLRLVSGSQAARSHQTRFVWWREATFRSSSAHKWSPPWLLGHGGQGWRTKARRDATWFRRLFGTPFFWRDSLSPASFPASKAHLRTLLTWFSVLLDASQSPLKDRIRRPSYPLVSLWVFAVFYH